MSHPHFEMPQALYAAYKHALSQKFYPLGTVRCSGDVMFRSQLARDLGCLLDVDDHVVAWLCLPTEFPTSDGVHVPDFVVDYDDGRRVFLDACGEVGSASVSEGAACSHVHHRFVSREETEVGCRLANAKDMLRYTNYRTPLNDRMRLLAALEEAGSLAIGQCMHLFREVQPMTGISWMLLNRMISADLDERMLGPETMLRRFALGGGK
ncbi:hypothetical protein [Rhizobium sp. BK060]|uniref:hypothetical protein n=1 Tax=Rhizobium sp. BK060 TaxID=2587096 RepID=UPI0018146561|nr:hypothetical protein [Rhizobium sp. BK060]MBB3394195.1 hypothetical protein [Rhizobium sp. BK060]